MDAQIMKDYIVLLIPRTKVFPIPMGYAFVHRDFRVYVQCLPKRTDACTELRISRLTVADTRSPLITILTAQLKTFCQRQGYLLTINGCSSKQLQSFWQQRGFQPDQNGVLTCTTSSR